MIKIKVDTGNGAYQYLELLPNLSFEKTNHFFKFSELEYGRTQSFKLPRTEVNERILENAGSVYEYGQLMRVEIPCRIQYGAKERSGKITINSATPKEYSCTLYYELSDLLDWVNDRKLNEFGSDWSIIWNYEHSHAANDPTVASRVIDILPYMSEAPEAYIAKNQWCWMPSFNIGRVISSLFQRAQNITGDYGTRLYDMFDEVPEEDRYSKWMVMNKTNRDGGSALMFSMTNNIPTSPLGEVNDTEFSAVVLDFEVGPMGEPTTIQLPLWTVDKEVYIIIPAGFPSGVMLCSPRSIKETFQTWINGDVTQWYVNLKTGWMVSSNVPGSKTLEPGDRIKIDPDIAFGFFSITDMYYSPETRTHLFRQAYNGGTYNLITELAVPIEDPLIPSQSNDVNKYHFLYNAPEMTLMDLCKIYGSLTNTVLTFEDSELRFLKDAGYHEMEIKDCVSFTDMERCVGDWSVDEVVRFDSDDDENILNPVSVTYHTENLAKDQSTNERVLQCSESFTRKAPRYYGDGIFIPNQTRLAIHDCEIEYEDEHPDQIKSIKADMDKPVAAALQTGNVRTLKRVSLPVNKYYKDMTDYSTKVKAKWRMPIEEFIKMDHTYRFIYRGRKYAWLDAKWSNGLVECTLQRSEYTAVDEYYINVTHTNGGDAGTSGYAREGDTWFIWARAAEGFEFSHWELDGQELQGEGSDFSFTVSDNAHFHAVFLGDECTITTSPDPNGAGTTTGGGTYRAGEVCTVRATDNGGYRFREWTESGETVSTDRNYSFVVTRDRTLVAEYDTLEKYNVRVTTNPTGVGQTYGGGSYYEGTTATVGVTTNQRAYAFMGWTDLDTGQIVSLSTSFSFVVERDWNLEATYFGGCTVTTATSPYNAGQTYGDGFYNDGDSVTVGFTPDQRAFSFDHWEYAENPGTSVSSNNPYTFTIHQNTYLVAVCQQQGVKVAVNVTPNGGGTVTGAGEYVSGDTCTLVATPSTGYGFSRYEINGQTVSSNRTYSFTVTGDTVVDAIFYNLGYIVTVNANPVAGGTVTGGGTYQYGQSVTITATPNQNYSFTGWYRNGQLVSTSASYTFTVTQSAAFTAMFQGQKVNIRTSVTPSGSGQTSGGGSYSIGSSCTVSAVPYNGYAFLRWEESGSTVSNNASYTFTVSAARNLVAVFQTKEKHNISTSVYPTGAGTVLGGGSYYTGDTCQLTALSNSNWQFVSWEENSSEVSLSNPYSFTVTRDRTLTANYRSMINAPDNEEEP